MRIRKLCIVVGSVMTFLIGVSVPMTVVHADESTGTIMMIEEGRVLNPEAIRVVGYADSDERLPERSVSEISEPLRLEPTWTNPNYAGGKTRAVKEAACTSAHYKVITKVGAGGGYSYRCWTGSGFYYSKTAFDTWGGGVQTVCPGRNKGAIYYQGTWDYGDHWKWSPLRGPLPSNASNYCYNFKDGLMKYRAVMLN
ncbi:hypothetical protein [Bifidobacterium catulorum]|uniref:hypothetical protein n=1 Tax=Bifidobacterium catulorum TaxID=1630173 RepID=UPI0011B22E14|nr:hypothetical protein [Bifidobacterium catulorum]